MFFANVTCTQATHWCLLYVLFVLNNVTFLPLMRGCSSSMFHAAYSLAEGMHVHVCSEWLYTRVIEFLISLKDTDKYSMSILSLSEHNYFPDNHSIPKYTQLQLTQYTLKYGMTVIHIHKAAEHSETFCEQKGKKPFCFVSISVT